MAVASRFLPPDFAPSQTVVVIAGKGRYPALLVECARARGAKIKLVSFEEETDPALIAAFDPADHRPIPVGKLGQMLDALQELGAARRRRSMGRARSWPARSRRANSSRAWCPT